MKKIFLFLIVFSTYVFSQTCQIKEIRTVRDSNNTIIEIVVELQEIESGIVFSYGLPQSEWNKTEAEQEQYAINYFLAHKPETILITTKKIKQPTVNIKKK